MILVPLILREISLQFIRPRIVPFVACLISVGLCLTYARYRSELPPWWKSVGGGIPYVVFWITLWFTAFPNRRFIPGIAVSVVLFTCFLEVLQLWRPEPLVEFRSTRFGAALLGSTFVWQDFPPYLMGGVIGFFLLRAISMFRGKEEPPVHR